MPRFVAVREETVRYKRVFDWEWDNAQEAWEDVNNIEVGDTADSDLVEQISAVVDRVVSFEEAPPLKDYQVHAKTTSHNSATMYLRAADPEDARRKVWRREWATARDWPDKYDINEITGVEEVTEDE